MSVQVLKIIMWADTGDTEGGAYRMLRAVDKAREFWPESKVCVVTVDGVAYVVTRNKKSVTVRRNI